MRKISMAIIKSFIALFLKVINRGNTVMTSFYKYISEFTFKCILNLLYCVFPCSQKLYLSLPSNVIIPPFSQNLLYESKPLFECTSILMNTMTSLICESQNNFWKGWRWQRIFSYNHELKVIHITYDLRHLAFAVDATFFPVSDILIHGKSCISEEEVRKDREKSIEQKKKEKEKNTPSHVTLFCSWFGLVWILNCKQTFLRQTGKFEYGLVVLYDLETFC